MRSRVLAILCSASLMIVLDSTIVAVALPRIQHDLGFSAAGVAWVVNGYLVAFAGLLLISGRLGDLFGARRVFLSGIALFTAASALCGLAPTATLLVTARFAQGAGGALCSAVVIGMIVRLYPAPGEQARAMGIYSFTQAGGAVTGFVVGGVLTDALGWPAIFLINVPIGVAVVLLGRRWLPRTATTPGGLDVLGAALITVGLSAGVYAIVQASPIALAVSVTLVVAFLARLPYARTPLVPREILRRSWLRRSNLAMALLFATGMGFQFLCALFVQRVMGYDALHTGLAFLPTPLVIGAVSLFVAPAVTARFGPRPVLITGELVFATGLILLSRLPADTGYWTGPFVPLIVMGLGFGVSVPAVIMLSMAGAGPSDAGLISGVGNTSQQAGGALGIAILAAVAAARTSSTGGLRDGYSLGFLVAAGFTLLSLLVVAFLLRGRAADFPLRGEAQDDVEAVHGPGGGRQDQGPDAEGRAADVVPGAVADHQRLAARCAE